ncbi:hypothetical protein [Paenibacillus odorifer]|uniref:hypothetical protein n=1 Tax=Paenibacillus odorifer TaxID=189426 RepID=UPI00096F52EA|nr:hypothetical protein [Paenibacillus odorifer]OME41403.1 hypothetical protein BSK58_14815 [Paenibacillus odorifer]
MGFTIDWGTMVISVPVMAASCFGAAKFFGKEYFKEQFDKKSATNLQEIKKEYDIFKSKLETDQEEYIKKLDIEIERNKHIIETYTPKYITATEQVRNAMKDAFAFLNTEDVYSLEKCDAKSAALQECIEINRVYITDNFFELIEKFKSVFRKSSEAKYYIVKSPSDAVYDSWSKNYKELTSLHNEIENLLRKELTGSV